MQNLTIDSLPDIALLEVFDHYRLTEECRGGFNWMWWYTLAHVCHRWRQVILASPERLSLRYLITHGSPVTDILRHQPRLPLVLEYWDQDTVDDEEDIDPAPWSSDSVEGITLALVHLDRIRHIAMQCGSGDLMHTILEMLARPARQLEILSITSLNQVTSPLSTLLGGHAPALRLLTLECVLVPLPSAPLLSQLTLVIGCDEVDAFAVDKILEGIHAMSQSRHTTLRDTHFSHVAVSTIVPRTVLLLRVPREQNRCTKPLKSPRTLRRLLGSFRSVLFPVHLQHIQTFGPHRLHLGNFEKHRANRHLPRLAAGAQYAHLLAQ
ncbi:hypothetical protein BC834DRAFT_668249 [Gloeopeniophorella convolvens]|nr:hypothetical protein BC834DRAFT_668249 [Gloeopeniophorella convolvens]